MHTIRRTFAFLLAAALAACSSSAPKAPTNRAPVASAGTESQAAPGDEVVLDGSASADPDGDALTFAWRQIAGPPVALRDAGSVRATFTAPDTAAPERLVFELAVADGTHTTRDDAEVVVAPADGNRAPVADAGFDREVHPGETVALDGSASADPDGDALSFTWRQTAGSAANLTGADTARATFVAPAAAASTELGFELKVSDGKATAADAVVVRVVPVAENRAPTAVARAPETTTPGSAVALDATGSTDPEGATLSFAWRQTGGAQVALVNAATATASFTAPAGPELLEFEVAVSDGVRTSTARVAVEVYQPNRAPVADAGPDQSVTAGAQVALDGSRSSDADGDALRHSWRQTGGATVALSDAQAARPSFTAPAAAGALAFELAVSDGLVEARDVVSVAVAAAPADSVPPVVTVTSPAADATVSGSVSIAGTASDEGRVASVELRVDGGAARACTGTTTWSCVLDTTALANGAHTLAVRATDAAGNRGEASRAVRVENPAVASFRFLSWGDTKTGLSTLAALSKQAKAHAPAFSLYVGDLQESGFTSSGIATWRAALDGNSGNGTFDRNFAMRGNHDASNTSGWQGYFDMRGVAARVGATNYSAMSGADDLTYSFDYGNAHFAVVDVPGDNNLFSSAKLAWLDADLSAAEARGLTHAFLFWHGPVYPVANHCCPVNTSITAMLNKHPIVSATFHGHEHVYAYVHMSAARISNITHPFEQFVTGAAGAGPNSCASGRTDACMASPGYAVVDVAGRSWKVTWYKQGSTTPQRVFDFTKP